MRSKVSPSLTATPPEVNSSNHNTHPIHTTSFAIQLSWFGRLFSSLQSELMIDEHGIVFPDGFVPPNALKALAVKDSSKAEVKGKRHRLLWQHFDVPPVFEWRWLGATLIYRVDGVLHELHFIGYRDSRALAGQIKSQWAHYHQKRLLTLVSNVENTIQARYLRHSRLQAIQLRVAKEYPRWMPWAQSSPLSHTIRDAVAKLNVMHNWSETDIAELRECFIQNQLRLYRHYFDTVESNPMTEKQRRASVIDDDSNLLLAGAGTGKTSVMVARAGYLLTSEQARPEEILLLAYGKKAATEMDERIKDKLGIDNIKTSTFHSLGLTIISHVEGKQPSLSAWVNDQEAKTQWVQAKMERQLLNARYCQQLIKYVSEFYYQPKNTFEFTAQSEVDQYLRSADICTLKGERVSDVAHMHIANWLFLNGFEYHYQATYEFGALGKGKRVSSNYHHKSGADGANSVVGVIKADFYLPVTNVYIDYYAIDENGDTPIYKDKHHFEQMMQSKRELYRQRGSRCIELFYHQYAKGRLNHALKRGVVKMQLDSVPIDDEAVLNMMRQSGRLTKLAGLLSQFITVFKSTCQGKLTLEKILNRVAGNATKTDIQHIRLAFSLLRPIYQQYQKHLSQHGQIDFEDMVGKAIHYVEQNKFIAPWRYIMVDEFQDISEPRARLVRALRDSTWLNSAQPERAQLERAQLERAQPASLFCVGDDWQAIYRFSGADVSLTTGFSQYFGPSSQSILDQTFRFNDRIGNTATQFVSQNPEQINKEIRSLSKADKPSVSMLFSEVNTKSIDFLLHKALADIHIQMRGRGRARHTTQVSTVYILGRFWFQLPDKETLKKLNQQYSDLQIRSLSIHAAKGKEADYAILTGMTQGQHGFPASKISSPLLEALLPVEEEFPNAEERRLLYVALTRAKHKVYILADRNQPSSFVSELMEPTFDVEIVKCA
ncbi:DNA helicase IV [Paraglaciecola mesophila]|uniref:DNA 3'-5' helicase n=1 Tax=Paraglaciecola mesophila TaxID=197222 RepID=A0A857JGZ2_9ALTE|nr:UvrD-helicase domain-containing protein [Paraglaciecola mesophila]QHJ10468.1 DNA helicase IV [Paraglaciecola mesophila]